MPEIHGENKIGFILRPTIWSLLFLILLDSVSFQFIPILKTRTCLQTSSDYPKFRIYL